MRGIDVRHLGRERVICCWQVGELLIDPGPESSSETLLRELGEWRPRALLLTHIHLDHAGASGALVRRWPDLQVYVHERGAPHVAHPEKLLRSAARLYGEGNMEHLWGEVVPIPEQNIHALAGGERIELEGGLRVAYTPGHASHHVSYLHEDSGRAFVGDTGGVRIPPSDMAHAPTPPPDIDIEAWQRSLQTIRAWRPASLGITHFGAFDDVERQLDQVEERLLRWGALARELDQQAWIERVQAEIDEHADGQAAASSDQAAPLDQQYQGLARYWSKREQARGAADVSSER